MATTNPVELWINEENERKSAQSVEWLCLTNFRNYREISLKIGAEPVILTGDNGSGKTNLLEALSFLVPGKGLRRADLGEVQNIREPSPWAVAVKLNNPFDSFRIGTGRDPEAQEGAAERRVVHIDGRPIKSRQILAERVSMTWITPDMDRVLSEGASARRKLLDRLVYSFDAAHAGRVNRYEKAMRERSRLLREGVSDSGWLSALEDEMAKTGVAIAAARMNMLRQLQKSVDESEGIFPKADLSLKGAAEQALLDSPALAVEDALREAFSKSRAQDMRSGICSVGAHRADLSAFHRTKGCNAEICSTGEQKALLVSIMLSFIRILTRINGMTPIVLLDDIAAHLDEIRRFALFEEIENIGAQAWITGTDKGLFSSFISRSQHFIVSDGEILAG